MTSTSSISPHWIAVDWGTSNLRAYAMTQSGKVLAEVSSDQGMSTLSKEEFEPALHKLLCDWILPSPCHVIACGMVGSRQGWFEAPYRSAPTSAFNVTPVHVPTQNTDLHIHILPGVKQTSPHDVMRGEETQIAGFLSLNPNWDGVICLPGTHSKWVQVSADEIVSFRTFMTGELFTTISTQTVLRHSLGGSGWDEGAFDAALSDTLSRPETLAARLFSLRAADLLEEQSPAIARARLSGMLIGTELAASKPYWLGQRVAIIGDTNLSKLYETALAAQGIPAERMDAPTATCAGLSKIYAQMTGA